MEDETPKQTHGQLEQTLAERIQVLYLTQLGHKPNKVSCQMIDKTLTIIIENSVTKLVRLLAESGKYDLAERTRFSIHKAFKPQLKALIEEVIGVSVIDLLGDSKLDTGFTNMIAVLSDAPKLSDSSSLPKVKQQTMSDTIGDK